MSLGIGRVPGVAGRGESGIETAAGAVDARLTVPVTWKSIRDSRFPIPNAHVRTRASITSPIKANTTFGVHAAISGVTIPLPPTAFVN